MKEETLRERLAAIVHAPGAELASLVVVVLREGETAFEGCWGRRYIDPEDPSRDLPATMDTKFRIASISKPFAAVAVLQASERGLLDLEADVSRYLDFPLRNPSFPDIPITAAMLLSHTSSLRDGESYSLPLGARLEDFFRPGSAAWRGGAHFAVPIPGEKTSRTPGTYYSYSNLGFGVLASALETVYGTRFDLLMRDKVLGPMGLDASHNVNLLSDTAFGNLATLYRKRDASETWNSAGPWIPQADDYRGVRPTSPCALSPGLEPEALSDYVPGANGTLFSPQGGLRASARDLAKLARLFLGRGEMDGNRLLSPESADRMLEPRWTWDPERQNGDLDSGKTRQTCLGLVHSLDIRDEWGGDRILPDGGFRVWGHHGDAFGLLGALLFRPERRDALIYLLGGTAADPLALHGQYSSYFFWKEEIQRAAAEFLEEFR